MIARHLTPSARPSTPTPLCPARIQRKRIARWAGIGSSLFAGLLVASLFSVPQSFTSRLSLSFASALGGSNGLLASVGGLGTSPATKYIGVIRSRNFAENVLQQVDIQHAGNFRTHEDAMEALQDGLMVLDNPRDGLLYISVTLDGPARLAPHAGARRARIKQAASQAANLYGDLLRSYLAHSDMDSDAILLQGAEDRIHLARQQYDAAVARLADYVRLHGGAGSLESAHALPQTPSNPSDAESARTLQSLYTVRATLEQEMASVDTSQRVSAQMQDAQLARIDSLPSEDPLLTEARGEVNAVRTALDNERVLLGAEHPRVVADQEKLRLAEARLQRQIQTLRQGITSQKIDAQVKRNALRARYDTVARQIATVEQKSLRGQEFATGLEQRRNEVLLQLEALKTTSAQAAILSMQVVSAQNRIKVVDTAQPARSGSPGVAKLAFLCLLLTGLCVAAGLYGEQVFARRSRNAPQLELMTEAG